jgi:D-3-phosphoglycerate dehydrogenase
VKSELVMVGPLLPRVMNALDADYIVHRLWEAADRHAFLASKSAARGIVTDGARGAPRDLMAALPRLEIVAVYGVGTDAIDLGYARDHGITVTNTPDVLTEDVADLGLGLCLAVLRGIARADRFVRLGAWGTSSFPLQRKFSGKRAGIVGLGRVGQALAHRLTAFDVAVSYHGRRARPELPYRFYADVRELAEHVDILIIAASGGSETRNLIGKDVLEALGPEGILVNISRGSVVDETALVAALEQGKIAGAGLDVFADEPCVPQALLTMENVVLQPHHASGTVETRTAMGELVMDNLRAHFAGRPVITRVV